MFKVNNKDDANGDSKYSVDSVDINVSVCCASITGQSSSCFKFLE